MSKREQLEIGGFKSFKQHRNQVGGQEILKFTFSMCESVFKINLIPNN